MCKRKVVSQLSLGLLLAALAFAMSAVCGAQTSKDSNQFSAILADIKTEALQLRHDAEDLKTFTHNSHLTWESHAQKVTEIKDHVNEAGKLLAKLDSARGSASLWQQEAFDHIVPMMKELASSVEATIEHFDQRPGLLRTGPYVEFADANYELASNSAEVISDYVEYGKSKAKSDELAAKLAVPEN
jgi:hypothetical protein